MITHPEIFEALIQVIRIDNQYDGIKATPDQALRGAAAVQRMQLAGVGFPDTQTKLQEDMSNIDSPLWQLAAGELSEMEEQFSKYDGYEELNKVLNEVFENGD